MWKWIFSACTSGFSCWSTNDWNLKVELTQLSKFHFPLPLSFSVCFLGLIPLWNYGNCLLQNWCLQRYSLSSLTVQLFKRVRLSLDLNLSQNQSHSQATQPFCIPISPLCLCRDKNACRMPMRDNSNSVWCISRGDRWLICIKLVNVSSTIWGFSIQAETRLFLIQLH